MERLRIVALAVALTSSSCVGAGLGSEGGANTFADSSGVGPGSSDAEASPTSSAGTEGPGTTNGCVAAEWDDAEWDGACWQ